FIHVDELCSFTRASVVLDVAQPALSRQVRLLELELGQPLLVRNGRGVTPTEAGALLLERGRGILHQFDNLREELAQLGGGTRGNIALGMPPTVSKVLAVPLVRAVRRHLPGVTLSLSEGLSTTMLQSLAAGQLDLALVYDGPAQPGIATEAVFEEPLMLFSRASAGAQAPPVPLAALAGLPLVIPRRPICHLPGVTLSLSEGLSTTMLQSLAAGQLDLALVYDGPAQPGIATEAVFEEPLMLFSRASAGAQAPPVPLAALAGLPLVIPRR